MKKLLASFAVGLVTLSAASPALAADPAERSEISGHFVSDDPFDPLIEDEPLGGNVTVDGGTLPDGGTAPDDVDTDGDGQVDDTDATDGTGANGDVFVNGGTEVLPNTGAEPSAWIVIAYGLIAAGLAALVLARTFASTR